MKKLLYLISILLFASVFVNAQQCCPQFKVVPDLTVCADRKDSPGTGTTPTEPQYKCELAACKNATLNYSVYPNLPGFTYTWSVINGTPVSTTGSTMPIHWGTDSIGIITVNISNADGSCKQKVELDLCLLPSPTANFNTSSATICKNSNVIFNNTSIGAAAYYWDFGDGTTSTDVNPSHIFTTPGTYNVVLTAAASAGGNNGPHSDMPNCSCKDTFAYTIIVKAEAALDIIPGCKRMLCAGDTAEYCTSFNCDNYNWIITGGTILGSSNSKCIKVIWNGTYPATVSLSGNCGAACGNTATLNVPVLFPSMPIIGNNIVCPNSTNNYSLPSMPGTFYTWSVTPTSGASIVGPDKNVSNVQVKFSGTTGTYTINCNYNNPTTKCSGNASITVNIKPPFKISGDNFACLGYPFNYTAPANAVWTITPITGHVPATFPNGTSIAGNFTGLGTYTISAMPLVTTNYCSYPDVISLVVNDTPKLSAINGPSIICPGGTFVYSVSSNMSGNFDWSDITGATSVSPMGSQQDSVSVTWNATGPYHVEVYQTTDAGCSAIPKKLNVTPIGMPNISGSNTACMDVVLTYTTTGAVPPGGFVWSISNALGTLMSPQGGNTMNVLWHGSSNPANNTSAITVTTCGGSATIPVTITSAPAFTITGVNPLCTPTGKTLTGSLPGTYTWFLNGNPTTFNTQSINVSLAGVYMAEVLLASGCKAKAYYTVVAEQKPNASISTTGKIIYDCTETISTLLTALPTGAPYCYQWFTSAGLGIIGSPISGATSSSYTATNAAFFWCEVSYCGTGCKASSDTIQIRKRICGTGCTVPPPNISVAKSNCNPFTFNASLSPASPAGNVTWSWHDGTTSSGFSATHQYKFIGTFPVCLSWAYSVAGACSKDSCFTVTVPLAANFSIIANCNGVNFINLSQSISTIDTCSWNFGADASPATSISCTAPTVTYTTGGLKTVSLTVTKNGCSVTYIDTFTVRKPIVAITVPTPVCALTNASFTATGGNSNWQYNWNFGDGYISNLQNPTHAYVEVLVATNYTVSLTVTNEFGCTTTVIKPITVSPSLKPNIAGNSFICVGDSTLLTCAAGFASYQWYKDGAIIVGATINSYYPKLAGSYYVIVSNGTNCSGKSNTVLLKYHPSPSAKIKKKNVQCQNAFNLSHIGPMAAGNNYSWLALPATGVTFTVNNSATATTTSVTVPGTGSYQFVLTVSNTQGCISKDTICVLVDKNPILTVTAPTGPLCEGVKHTFTANATPTGTYLYQWINGVTGNTMTTGLGGSYAVTATNNMGCRDTAFVMINKRVNVSLFPVGCDTLCLTDTIRFPLPQGGGITGTSYTVNWFDSGVPVGSGGVNLPLANIGPGDHHFTAAVSIFGSCKDTTGSFDLFIKDCTLTPPCDNCTSMFDSAKFEMGAVAGNIMQGNFTFTISKNVKEVRINVADLKYHWDDPSCKNCKAAISDRACIYPASATQTIGNLVWDNFTGAALPPSTSTTDCPKELIFKLGVALPAGTYSIPLQVSFADAPNSKCKLVVDKFCMHLALTSEDCKVCEKNICANNIGKTTDDADCDCGKSNIWNNLYLTSIGVGIPKPKTLIICNSSITGYNAGVPYLLSGMYNCKVGCNATKMEVVIRNQTGDIIYTHIGATLYETIVLPIKGIYTVTLTAHCGNKKCECKFQIVVNKDRPDLPEPPPTSTPVKDPPITGTPKNPEIEKAINEILPPDFSGQVLVAKHDTILYEKYKGTNVNNHTAFDLASVAKTFTAMAILKMAEEKKISLSDDVTKYLNNFPINGITIKMLLSHTSGLEDYVKFMQDGGVDKTEMLSNGDLLQYIVKNKNKVQSGKLGGAFNYSNTNFAMLALVIEKISGQQYGQYLSDKFFKPLKMDDTYVFTLANAKTATPSYYKNGKAYDIKFLDFIYGDKNIYTTVKDMMKWDKALRDGKIFSKESLALAYTPGTNLIPDQSNYGLGWRILLVPNGKKIIYHNGWWHGNRSVFIRLLDEDALIVILSNSSFTSISNSRKLADLFGEYKQSGKSLVGF